MVDDAKTMERIVKLETEVMGLREQAKAHASDTKDNFSKVNDKLDNLNAMMSKGRGIGTVLALIGVGVISLTVGHLK